jgi:hypothetical protein
MERLKCCSGQEVGNIFLHKGERWHERERVHTIRALQDRYSNGTHRPVFATTKVIGISMERLKEEQIMAMWTGMERETPRRARPHAKHNEHIQGAAFARKVYSKAREKNKGFWVRERKKSIRKLHRFFFLLSQGTTELLTSERTRGAGSTNQE